MKADRPLPTELKQRIMYLERKCGVETKVLVEIITEWNQWVLDNLENGKWRHCN